MVEVLKEGYRIPLLTAPPLSPRPVYFNSDCPQSKKGLAVETEIATLLASGAVERVLSPGPGFYSRIFVVLKASGSW